MDGVIGGYHQKAVWGLMYRFRNSLPEPLNKCAIYGNNAFSNELIDRAISYSGEPCSTGKAQISTSELKMDGDTGKITINELTGIVTSVTITFDGEAEGRTITGWGNDKLFRFYNSNGQEAVHIGNMTKNTTYQLKNYTGKNIKSMSISVAQNPSGYRVYGNFYISNTVQSIMHAIYEPGKGSTASTKVKIKYSKGEITVKKVDYTNSDSLDGAKFAVFAKDITGEQSGWLGYDSTNKEVTYGKTWKEAGKFKTGSSYCKVTKTEGQFTLKNLKFGTYYVFEVEPAEGYEKEPQYGWNTSSGSGLFESQFEMIDNSGEKIKRLLIGDYKSFKDDYVQRELENYQELRDMPKKLWEVYNDKRKTI